MTSTDDGDPFGAEKKFSAARSRLDRAQDAFVKAQTELIQAQREYNDASRDYVRSWDEVPKRGAGSVYGRFTT